VVVGVVDSDGAADDGDVGESVAEIVDENTAEIKVLVTAHDGEGDAAVDGESGERSPDHPAFDDFDRGTKALDGFVAEPGGEKDEKDRVGECGESSGAMIAVGFVAIGGAFCPAHGEPGDAESWNVGKIVNGVV